MSDQTNATLDVAVVGGGIVGAMAALHLAEDGRRVTLIEPDEVAMGASFGNAGILAFPEILPLASPGMVWQAPRWLLDPLGPLSVPPAYAHRIAPWLVRFLLAARRPTYERSLAAQTAMMRLARDAMMAVIGRAGLDAHIAHTGTLDLYDGKAAFDAAAADWERKRLAGLDFRRAEGPEVETLQPGLHPRFHERAMYTPDGLQVRDPHLFARAAWEHAAAQGAGHERARVRAILPRRDGVQLVLETGAPLLARTVVLTAGAHSRPLAAGLGDPIPLETERGYNSSLPAGAFDLRRQLYFNGHGFVATPVAGGVRIGGAVELGGLGLPANHRRSQAMLDKAARFMPGLRTDGAKQWMGMRPSLPDSLPVIGRSRGSTQVIYAFGHGHLGLTQSAATGRLVADLAAGRRPAIDLSPFSPARFA